MQRKRCIRLLLLLINSNSAEHDAERKRCDMRMHSERQFASLTTSAPAANSNLITQAATPQISPTSNDLPISATQLAGDQQNAAALFYSSALQMSS